MASLYENLLSQFKKLPGLGSRSAERICLHLLAEKPEKIPQLIEALDEASRRIRRCVKCGNLTESELCEICEDPSRDSTKICIVETIPDLVAFEKSGAWRGLYHILNGKLSPLKGVGPESLNIESLGQRVESDQVTEILLALTNDIEGEATCHYIESIFQANENLQISRIGFGLPSGGDITYADTSTLRNALESRTGFRD